MADKNRKKGLGTGLDILFGDPGPDAEESELKSVPIGRVEPREDQPRMNFDPEALQDLAESIKKYGLIQPIIVRKASVDDYYQIIAGERRWRASKLAGLDEVPVRIIEADDRRTAELALVENLQREDLNPIEEAKGFKALIEDYGLTQEETASGIGKSRSAVANSLRLLSLNPEVMSMVEKGELSAGHARTLLALNNDRQQTEAAKEIIKKNMSVRRTEKYVFELNKPKESENRNDEPVVDYAAVVSDKLSESLGRKVRLTDGKKTGKIEIEFYGADDREALIEALSKLKV